MAANALDRLDDEATTAAPKCFSQWNIQVCARDGVCHQSATRSCRWTGLSQAAPVACVLLTLILRLYLILTLTATLLSYNTRVVI